MGLSNKQKAEEQTFNFAQRIKNKGFLLDTTNFIVYNSAHDAGTNVQCALNIGIRLSFIPYLYLKGGRYAYLVHIGVCYSFRVL